MKKAMSTCSLFAVALVVVMVGMANWSVVSGCQPTAGGGSGSASENSRAVTPVPPANGRRMIGMPDCDPVELLHCQRMEELVDIIPQAQWPAYLAPGLNKCETKGVFKACGVEPKLRHPAIALTTSNPEDV